MSDNNEEIKDLITDEEEDAEYERALAALNKSKGERVKKITEEKKAKKKEAKAKEEADKPAPSGFIAKCKKDPVIPITIILLVAVVVGILIHIIVPMLSVKSLGVTVDEFRENYSNASIYRATLAPYNFAIPEVTYTDGKTLALTAAGEAQNREEDKLQYFSAAIPNTATTFSTAIQGSVRKSDNKITAIRVMAQISDDPNYFNFLVLYFGSYLQALAPDVSDQDIETLVAEALNNVAGADFTVRQDIAFRASLVNGDSVSYVAFDIMPAGNL
ncbi:MAG: hypothetical protein IJ757_03595 [Clostridiales bacterium]|nr:hypothetical protein [Clostridiales bacterium]